MKRLVSPDFTVLYTIEKAIKAYRKFSQINISKRLNDITVDQTLLLLFIDKNPELTQKELARLVFKDYASVTRIIELMVKKDYLQRHIHVNDRRRFKLKITEKGQKAITTLAPVINKNRKTALDGLSQNDTDQLQKLLEKIIVNCHNLNNR